MNALVILNDGPYGTERSYNGLEERGEIELKGKGRRTTYLLVGRLDEAGRRPRP